MAYITHQKIPVTTIGQLPAVGQKLPPFKLLRFDLSEVSSETFAGKKILFNIFPSIDTSVCASSVRTFNKEAAGLKNVLVLCVSEDLPFAQKRFCAAENIANVEVLSSFRTDFGKIFGARMITGPLAWLLSRAIVVADESGTVLYTEQVPEITQDPNYADALKALK